MIWNSNSLSRGDTPSVQVSSGTIDGRKWFWREPQMGPIRYNVWREFQVKAVNARHSSPNHELKIVWNKRLDIRATIAFWAFLFWRPFRNIVPSLIQRGSAVRKQIWSIKTQTHVTNTTLFKLKKACRLLLPLVLPWLDHTDRCPLNRRAR